MKVTTANFIELYMEHKMNGCTDKEICDLFGLKRQELSSIKKFLDCPKIKTSVNPWLTEKELQIAIKNGIGRRIALRRRRELGWSVEDSIHRPKEQGSRYVQIMRRIRNEI
jgi:hypothetical protein